jgi:hypothetical protein
MIAILSATEHDYYAMPLPFACYSWKMIGIHSLVFVPDNYGEKLKLSIKYASHLGGLTYVQRFTCEEKRIPTYSQVVRNFGAALAWNPAHDPSLITGDSDMCVFGDFFKGLDDGGIHVVGSDLTPTDQYPMCFCAMPVSKWEKVMGIHKGYQEHVSELIDPIEGQNIRGEQWSYDQWYLKKMLDQSGEPIIFHPRAFPNTQFATQRADRDGWHFNPDEIIDAHLPRPLTDESNFQKVIDLFQYKYPNDDFTWAYNFRNEYMKLL